MKYTKLKDYDYDESQFSIIFDKSQKTKFKSSFLQHNFRKSKNTCYWYFYNKLSIIVNFLKNFNYWSLCNFFKK